MALSEARIAEIIDGLKGTCKAIYEVATDEERDDPDLLAAMDQEIFECDDCSWWCERSEESRSAPGICDDCVTDDEDDD